jgi:hypothetical protein
VDLVKLLAQWYEKHKLIDDVIARFELVVANKRRQVRPPVWLKAIQPHKRPKSLILWQTT